MMTRLQQIRSSVISGERIVCGYRVFGKWGFYFGMHVFILLQMASEEERVANVHAQTALYRRIMAENDDVRMVGVELGGFLHVGTALHGRELHYTTTYGAAALAAGLLGVDVVYAGTDYDDLQDLPGILEELPPS